MAMERANKHEPIWVPPPEDPKWLEKITDGFRIHPITAQILISRGFKNEKEINNFLYAQLPDLIDPKKFLSMNKAVKRVASAIDRGENILIYGDNDVDGMTGTVLLAEFLKKVGAKVDYFVPQHDMSRFEIFTNALEFAKERDVKLLISVDCGITATRQIEEVRKERIEVIITDHHEPTHKMPACTAILNPKLAAQTYPNRELTGVGVAFKFAHGITNYLVSNKVISPKKIDLKVYLDLVALGTIADMGAVLDENRILVRYGLKQLQKTKRVGLVKLFKVCGFDRSDITTLDIATKIAPRMNSLGRVADPRKGVELLMVRDEKKAEELAKELDLSNLERQKIEQIVSTDVEEMIAKKPAILKEKAIILASSKWHPGVIPIISARITKQYHRPTVIIAIDQGIGKGSIRTIREFPLLPTLKKSADLFLNFGGHDFAAGVTLREENIATFEKRFIHAANSTLKAEDLISKLYIDANADFKDLTYDLLASLELFEPHGNENMQPILCCEAKQAWAPKVIGGIHLKLYLEQGDRMLEGIAFGMADRRDEICKKNLTLKIAYTPQINRFHNKSSIQLLIRDFHVL
ncbi:MAG: Single-stranded-DNA-specific exonuclease RecJ [Chlamydiales bacterium]|nr:Single-stranded-DNA-specific exonuclease RecJ [Chlamydiales bacterium]MCH9619338.1 Single-stranded-DNA-specific exonuclease RecJ [Chlamydiales bacterium]MCH9622142.1 Single-stranded-DNA-specific exonuclease RecJ [Chlamydiales bacterium]